MDKSEWTRIFQSKANILKQEDTWQLEFDEQIIPDLPKPDWKQYIRNTGARFSCTLCKRSWPSNRVMVVFHMQLTDGRGTVKVRPFRQNCKKCTAAPMEKPSVSSENLEILMENLVEKIRIKCYHEELGDLNRHFRNLDVKSPHEPLHCEGCLAGICTKS